MGDNEVAEYLEHLVLKNNVAPRTQATALNNNNSPMLNERFSSPCNNKKIYF
ncbi:MAG: hypothetical protein ACI9LM_000420 [Alteromonadaceae bacterium]|jgi:hypothetical protein